MVFISILPFVLIGYIRLRKVVLPVRKSAGVTSVMFSFLRSSSNGGLGHKALKDE
jgi:hypothetical protein